VAFDVDHLTMMQEPIQDGGGDHRIAKQLLPISKAFVGGDDCRVLFIAIRDELEKQVRLSAVDGQIPLS
jgi:hypothetical protein